MKFLVGFSVLFLGCMAVAQSQGLPNSSSSALGIEQEVEEVKKEDKEKGETSNSTTKATGDVEKISIVGSRIRRLDMEGPSPVHVITRDAIEKSGNNTLGEVLSDSPVSPYGGDGETVDVRGLGDLNTLILINGKRLPKQGSFYGSRASNVNAIPASAVERVEILADGASAIYGSEALASVINIVTRKDLNGLTASMKGNLSGPQGGDVFNTSLTYGWSSSKGHFNTSFEYLYGTGRHNKDLNITNPISLRDPRFSDNYTTPSTTSKTPFPNCQETDPDTGACSQYYGDILRSEPTSILSSFSEVSYELGSERILKADFFGRYAQYASVRPGYLKLTFNPEEVSASPAFSGLEGVQPGEALTITHQVSDVENQISDQQYTAGVNVGVEGPWGSGDWVWSLNNNMGYYKTLTIFENMALIDVSKRAITSGTYSLFEDTPRNMTGMFYSPQHERSYLLDTLDFSADGPLAEVGRTSLSLATGAQLGYHSYWEAGHEQAVNGNTSGLRGVVGSGQRSQQSVYAEMGATYSQWLEAQLAARYDNYSDFGSTINPKFALRVQSTSWLLFRGSVGTGFKAPELADVHGGKVDAYLTLRDYKNCEAYGSKQYCRGQIYEFETGGNPNLQEETSFSYNLGVGVQPTGDLNFAVDYWNYRVEDIVGVGVVGALKLEAAGGQPENYGIFIVRDQDGDPGIDKIIAPQNNLGVHESDGLDVKASWDLGSSSLRGNYSVILHDRAFMFKELGFQSTLGEYGQPRYRYVLTFDQKLLGGDYGFQVRRRTTGDYKTGDEQGKIPEHSQYDIFFQWNRAPYRGQLTAGAINVFNLQPKWDPFASPHVATSLHRAWATYYAGYRAQF